MVASAPSRPRTVVIGDPQASADRFFAILDRAGLRDGDRLADDVGLISVGDHFDYGKGPERSEAAASGIAILEWLASHSEDQVAILAGNHDLGRVGELAPFDDKTFEAAHIEATAVYQTDDQAGEADLLAKFPALPSAELAARDFAAFSSAQRDLVWSLLESRRLRVAVALSESVLACHAGVTIESLEATGFDGEPTAPRVAAHLNACLDQAVANRCGDEPLIVSGLHRPGDAAYGEGVGMFYHRPANPDIERNVGHAFGTALGRRYDPRRLVPGLTQVIGHISDSKCRDLLGPWAVGDPAPKGGLRHLTVTGEVVTYRAGLPSTVESGQTAMIFVDGGMSRVPLESYELLDVARVKNSRT